MRSLKLCGDAAPLARAIAVAMMVLLSGCATMQPPINNSDGSPTRMGKSITRKIPGEA